MNTASLTSKGQITIPRKIRAYLGVHAGDKLEFLPLPGGKVMVAPVTIDITELKTILPKPKKTISIDEMNKIIKKRGIEHARNRH